MPQLPDVPSLGFATPESTRSIVGYNGSQVGDALSRAGNTFEQVAAAEIRKQYEEHAAADKLQIAYGKANYLQGLDDAKQALLKDNEYSTYAQRFDKAAQDNMAKIAETITDPAAKRTFMMDAALATRSARNQVLNLQRQGQVDHAKASSLELGDRTMNLALSASDPVTRDQFINTYKDVLKANVDSNLLTETEATSHFLQFRDRFAKSWIQKQPVDKQIELLSPKPAAPKSTAGGFESAIQKVLANEGGYVAVDGASGAPAIYGINAKWHPEAYAEAKKIADAQGEEAGRKYAEAFYKREYWDKYDIGSLPPDTQAVVMDGVVNHRASFASQLVADAKAGGASDQLLSARQAEYERLATENPGAYGASLKGWTQRLDNFGGGKLAGTGTPADFLDVADRPLLLKQALLEKDRQIKAEEEQRAWANSVAKVESGAPLDPKDTLDREALNTYFDSEYPKWADNPQKALDMSAQFAAERGMVPDKLQTVIRSGLRGGNAEQAIAASDAVRRIKNGNPETLKDFSEKDLGLAEHIGSLTDAGFTPQEAYRRAMDAESAPESDIKARNAEYAAYVKKNPADGFIKSRLNSWFVNDPGTVPAPMLADFNTAAESEFQRTGNMDAAREMGLNAISRNWGASRVGADGNRYMRQSPERFYGKPNLSLQENADWMNKQLLDDAMAAAPADIKDHVSAGSVSIAPAYGKTDQPAYFVNVTDRDGVLHTLLDANKRPLLWRPDYGASEDGKSAAAQTQADLAAARDLRGKYKILETLPPDEPGGTAGLYR